ncbi:MAG: ABC transporter substrate-binding protein [Acidimicrobiales bacterium]
MLRKRMLTKLAVVGTAAACAVFVVAVGASSSATTSKPAKAQVTHMVKIPGGTMTYATPPGGPPTYIFPMMSPAYFSVSNFQLIYDMFRPMYWFGQGQTPDLNTNLSLADMPVYSNGGKTITVKMKGFKWSNGETVDAQDVVFWQNIMKVEPTQWGEYVPGPDQYPGNVVNIVANNATDTVTFTLNKPYGSYWYTYNELSQITPLPVAWDITSATAKPGSGGCSSASYSSIKTSTSSSGVMTPTSASAKACTAVWTFLTSKTEGASPSTYGTNPLWQTVDGPFTLTAFDATTGGATLVPNTKYSGSPKPSYSKLVYLPFTTDTSEFDVLAAGHTIDIGYSPPENIPAYKGPVWCGTKTCAGPNNAQLAANYTFAPEAQWGFNYFAVNYTNPTFGPIVKQVYIRDAMQSLQNQTLWAQLYNNGYAVPTYGPVPVDPPTNFASSFEKKNPLPYSPSHAISLLKSHGWTVVPNGVDTCTSPGTGANQCGAGIAKGAQLNFPFVYATGIASFDAQMREMAASWEQAGIKLQQEPKSFQEVLTDAFGPRCVPNKPCAWVVADWGGGWIYAPDFYPTGEALFLSGAGSNAGDYSNPAADGLISLTNTSSSLTALYNYEDFMATNLPVLYQPEIEALWEVSKNVCGALPDPLNILAAPAPEYWYFCKAAK